MRLFFIILALIFAALVGLYVYGEMLTPETRTIEQEAIGGANS